MNPDSRLPAIFSLVMIVATATLGWISLRPGGVTPFAEVPIAGQVPAEGQNIVARLWEDPLQAILAEVSKNKENKKHPAIDSVKGVVAETLKSRRVTLLVVPIPETPFPGDLESRLRMRYSLQMAMADKSYSPRSRSYLGYFNLRAPLAEGTVTTPEPPTLLPPEPDPAGNDGAAKSANPASFAGPAQESVFVPYEWFDQRKDVAQQAATDDAPQSANDQLKKLPTAALVLWLPEIFLRRDPLPRLEALCTDLGLVGKPGFNGIFMVGPRSSDALKSLIPKPGPDQKTPELHGLRNKLSIFSPQATAPDELIDLERLSIAREAFSQSIQLAFTGKPKPDNDWQYFHNFIATDDELTDLLVKELDLRGVDLRESSANREKILIIAEADTSYGRSLPYAFTQSLDRFRHPEKEAERKAVLTTNGTAGQSGNLDQLDAQLFIYRYLRGLDQQKGQPSSDKSNNRPAAKSPEDLLADVLSKKGAPAHGESQLDYVDRIRLDLEDWETRTSSAKVRAVGVLGGDIYDKLILLRSLREKYPQAIFFTTDLDARLWHPDHLPFTRNLVVASGCDVLARQALPNSRDTGLRIPPFRDGYQVAVFNACRAALGKGENSAAPVVQDLTPSIFEVGRNGPNKLIPGEAPQTFAAKLAVVGSSLWHYGLPTLSKGQTIGLTVAVLGVLAVIIIFRVYFVKSSFPTRLFNRELFGIGWVVIGSVLLLVIAYSMMQDIAAQPGSEPWIADQGISIWPTEIIRLFVAVSVIVAVVWSQIHRCRVHEKLLKDFGLKGYQASDFVKTKTREEIERNPEPVSARGAFHGYWEKTTWWKRCLRVTLLALAYVGFGTGLMVFMEGEFPFMGHIRGPVPRLVDKVILFSSILSFTWLLFYVLDAAWHTARLLRILAQGPTTWPAELVEREIQSTMVSEADVSKYLDVKFAASVTEEVGKLIILPFIVQLLFIISRSTYFDHWTWPTALIVIFLCNVFLAWCGWAILRRAARELRRSAKVRIEKEISDLKLGITPATSHAGRYQHRRRLEALRDKIDGLTQGAYSKTFQDPALMATVVPTGIFGILAVLFRTFFQ